MCHFAGHNNYGVQLARHSNQIPGETVGELAVAICMQVSKTVQFLFCLLKSEGKSENSPCM